MITLINYGLGNLKAFENLYKRLNILVKIANTTDDLEDTEKLILPGVGAFDHAMTQLNSSGMREKLDDLVLNKRIPILGICVGMQMLAKSSEEGVLPGLGWIEGQVKIFDISKIRFKTKLPHMGWNTINPTKESQLLAGFNNSSRFYFLHSFYFECESDSSSIATTEYGIKYSSAIHCSNVYGVQFHPEKSHSNGIQLLKNFANL